MSIATKRAYLKVLAGGGGTFMKHIKMFRTALTALVTVVLTGQSLAADIFVSPTGSGEKTGANWSNALNGSNDGWDIDIKNAITSAVDGGAEKVNVYFAAGNYSVTNQLSLSSITIPLTFNGGYMGATDGSFEKSEMVTTVTRTKNLRYFSATSLSDFSIEDMTFSGGKYYKKSGEVQGGACYLSSSSVMMKGCVFSGNWLDGDSYYCGQGGAIFSNSGSLTLSDCQFIGNYASACYYPHWGGAICTKSTTLLIDGCLFSGNYIKSSKVGGSGGALSLNGGVIRIKNSTFLNNYIYNDNTGNPMGGALAVRSAVRFEMEDCHFEGNYVRGVDDADYYSGCYFDDFNPADGVMTAAVTRCVFDSRTVATKSSGKTIKTKSDILINCGHLFMTNCLVLGARGGHAEMLYSVRAQRIAFPATASNKYVGSLLDLVCRKSAIFADCSLNLVNCTIADGVEYGVGGVGDDVTVDLKNCIVSGHSLTGVVNATSIEHSYIQTNDDGTWNYEGTGNLNPNVVGDVNWTGAPYYHLLTKNANGAITNGWFSGTFESPKTAADSPCIDAGAPGSLGLDLEPYYSGRRVNIGAYGGTPWASKTSPLPGFKLIVR